MSDTDPPPSPEEHARYSHHPGEHDGPREPAGSPRPHNSPPPAGLEDQPRVPVPRYSVEDSVRPLPDPPGRAAHASGAAGSARPKHTPSVPAQGARKRSVPSDAPDERSEPARTPHEPHQTVPYVLSHRALKSLLGAWALAACSPWEAEAVELHLGDCGACAEEALLLRDAVGLLHPVESLDLDPGLRTRVLESSLARRPPRIPVPVWAAPYDAETARLDALLQDIDAPEWHAPVRLRWYEDDLPVSRRTTVAAVLGHLLTVDGLVAVALGLPDPLGTHTPSGLDPVKRTKAYWHAASAPPTSAIRIPWRAQSHRLVRTAASAAGSTPDGAGRTGHGAAEHGRTDFRGPGHGVPQHGTAADDVAARPVPYGDFVLPLRDALVDRAFECWIHASDIAAAVDYPYGWAAPRHMHAIIELTARRLPGALAARRGRRCGPAGHPQHAADGSGRMLRLEIEGAAGGEWLVALDAAAGMESALIGGHRTRGRTAATGPFGREVAHVALDDFEFCRLAAGHISPAEAAAGSTGDRHAIADVLTAVASLSRM